MFLFYIYIVLSLVISASWFGSYDIKYPLLWNWLLQGDHNWTMKNPEVLANMRFTEETVMIFSNRLDLNEHRVTRRLIVIQAAWHLRTMDLESISKPEKSGDLQKNPEKWPACYWRMTDIANGLENDLNFFSVIYFVQ